MQQTRCQTFLFNRPLLSQHICNTSFHTCITLKCPVLYECAVTLLLSWQHNLNKLLGFLAHYSRWPFSAEADFSSLSPVLPNFILSQCCTKTVTRKRTHTGLEPLLTVNAPADTTGSNSEGWAFQRATARWPQVSAGDVQQFKGLRINS